MSERYRIPAGMSFQQYQQLKSREVLLAQLKTQKRRLQVKLQGRQRIVRRMIR